MSLSCCLLLQYCLKCSLSERAKDFQPPGVESIAIVVDYKSTTLRTNPSISVARKVLHILQAHYPETLGRGLVGVHVDAGIKKSHLLTYFYSQPPDYLGFLLQGHRPIYGPRNKRQGLP